ncbi:hypothetical protein [Rhodococcus xishaensis]|uniref:hypothetical protein n=1 Tax=Rhodococcus xishaensis TaxID=2487364 RepID=UPI001F1C19DD|nr:hypothetical protein [Rhodococcus xishaensis]
MEGQGWGALGGAVDAGDLYLEPGVARRCAQRCADLAAELRALRERAYRLRRVDGFGTQPSGLALKAKFEGKADGGEYSLVQALSDHIDEVERMQALLEKIDARYSATEGGTSSKFGAIEQG